MAHIEKRIRKDGTVAWRTKAYAGFDENGKQKFVHRTFERKKDAESAGRRADEARSQGMLPDTAKSRTTFLAYLQHWLNVKEGEVDARTIDDYRANVRRWIEHPRANDARRLAQVRLDRLGWQVFEDLYAWMYKECGLAPSTIDRLHTVLHQALDDAVKKGVIAKNPTDYAKRPKKRANDDWVDDDLAPFRAMSEAEANRFLDAAWSDRYFALWLVLLTGGLRPGEAYGLGWSDIDFDAGRIRIRRALSRRGVRKEGPKWRLKAPKNKKARRTVPVPPLTMRALRAWRTKQTEERVLLGAEWRDNDLVFTTPVGTPVDESNLSRSNFRRVLERAVLGTYGPQPPKPKGQPGPAKKRPFHPAHRIYDLRHTCATLLLAQGENLKVVSERLGHSTITLTADVYSHVLPDMQEAAAAKLEAMFGGGPWETNGKLPEPSEAKTVNFPKVLGGS